MAEASTLPRTDDGVTVVRVGQPTAVWLVVVLLAVIATVLIVRQDETALLRSALGQLGASSGAVGGRGIYAFPGQIYAKTYGVYMMDVDTGTLWCYALEEGPHNQAQLRLVASRSWVFDRYLEEFNVASPTPTQVQNLIEQQRANRTSTAPGP